MALPANLVDREQQKFIETADGGVAVRLQGGSTLVAGNSTTTALGGAETYTGTWTDVSAYASVVTACKSNVAGTLYMEFSASGSGNADSTLTYTVAAGINEVHRLAVTRKYYRSRYLNGAAAQTTFEISTLFGQQGLLSAPLNISLGQDSDAIAVRAIDAEIDIAEGKRSGYSIVNKFGRNNAVSTGDVPEDIWPGGGVYTGFPTGAAELVTVSSASTNDTAAGSGARTVTIYGLDAAGAAQSETVTLLGTSLVDSANTYTRVHRATVVTSGSSNAAFNDGIISVAHKVTTANVFVKIEAGFNESQMCIYTIPAGYTGYLRQLNVNISRSNTATLTGAVWIRNNGVPARLIDIFSASNTDAYYDTIYGGIVLTSLTDVTIRITTCSANNVPVTGHFDLIEVKN